MTHHAAYHGLQPVFQPTPSARRVTLCERPEVKAIPISTHTLREEGDTSEAQYQLVLGISTHTLREEGDDKYYEAKGQIKISTHTLREEGDKWSDSEIQ